MAFSPVRFSPNDEAMKKIEAIISPIKVEAVKNALLEIGVSGLTVTEALGFGCQKSRNNRGSDYIVDYHAKAKIEVVFDDALLPRAVEAIIQSTRTGEIGDGKIFVSTVGEVVGIRTKPRGQDAV